MTNNDLILELDGKPVNITQILRIDEANLTDEFAQQSSVFAWIAKLTADAEHEAAVAKAVREQEYAEADQYARMQLEKRGGKFTEAMVKAEIILDDEYSACEAAERNAQHRYRILRSITDALRMRADMLISMGAHLRAEHGMTGMHINAIDKEVAKIKKQV